MDKTIVGLIGAVTALAAGSPAQAAPTQLADVMQVSSYADLLKPVPNATEVLKASDAAAQSAGPEATLQLAQYDGGYGYGYHHQRYHHHHHHHHHGPRFFVNPYGFGYGHDGPRYHHHHHHHHYHHHYDNNY